MIFTLSTPGVRFVGKLVGRYYDSQGNATKYLKGAEAKSARGAQLLEKQKAEESKQPGCNSRWSQDEGGEVLISGTWHYYLNPSMIQLQIAMPVFQCDKFLCNFLFVQFI